MSETTLHIGIMLFGAFIASFAQLFLKKAALKQYPNFIKQYLNPGVITGYALMLVSTAAALTAFRVVPLSFAPISDAAALVFTTVLGVLTFKEKMPPKKIIGILIVAAGILVITL